MNTLANRALYDEVVKKTLQLQMINSTENIRFTELFKATKIPANTLQRFFNRYTAQRKTKTLVDLIRYFEIDESEIIKSLSDKEIPLGLTQLISHIWDGTEAHARQIEHLLLVSKQIRLDQIKEFRP